MNFDDDKQVAAVTTMSEEQVASHRLVGAAVAAAKAKYGETIAYNTMRDAFAFHLIKEAAGDKDVEQHLLEDFAVRMAFFEVGAKALRTLT